ncbi:MAG: hypothetical protein ACKO2G_07305 [Verrucomicrobiales bacterium]
MRTILHCVLLMSLLFGGGVLALPPPPADRIHDPASLLDKKQHQLLAKKLAEAAKQGADLWVVSDGSDEREQINSLASSLQAAWGRGPVSAVLIHAPAVRAQPFVHAGGVEAHLFDSGDLQDQLNGALQRALALHPERPLETAVDAMATEFAILDRRLTRLRERNLLALATANEKQSAPAQALPRWADSFVIPGVAIVLALGSLVVLATIIARHSRTGRPRHFPNAGFHPRFDAPFSGGSDFTRDLVRRKP